jgi:hypothetical protein
MSAPLSRVYPKRVELARRSPLLMVVPAVIVVSLLGIAGVGFAWSSAVRTKHAVTENFNALEKRLAQTEETNAQLRGKLSVVAGRLQLTPEDELEAQRIADRVRGMDARQIARPGQVSWTPRSATPTLRRSPRSLTRNSPRCARKSITPKRICKPP